MAAGLAVAFFNSLRQRKQDAFGLLQAVQRRFMAQKRFYPGAKEPVVQRLAQKVVGSRLERSYVMSDVASGTDHHNGDQFGPPLRFDVPAPGQRLRSGYLVPISDDQIHTLTGHDRGGIGPVPDPEDTVAFLLENRP